MSQFFASDELVVLDECTRGRFGLALVLAAETKAFVVLLGDARVLLAFVAIDRTGEIGRVRRGMVDLHRAEAGLEQADHFRLFLALHKWLSVGKTVCFDGLDERENFTTSGHDAIAFASFRNGDEQGFHRLDDFDNRGERLVDIQKVGQFLQAFLKDQRAEMEMADRFMKVSTLTDLHRCRRRDRLYRTG